MEESHSKEETIVVGKKKGKMRKGNKGESISLADL
jgi:hypothetical protein